MTIRIWMQFFRKQQTWWWCWIGWSSHWSCQKLVQNKKCCKRLIAKAVFDSHFTFGMSFTNIINWVKLWLWKNVFTPQAVLWETDLTGGTLNHYEGINNLRNIEPKRKRHYRGSVLPSPACVKRAAKVVGRKADEICPVEDIQTQCIVRLKL